MSTEILNRPTTLGSAQVEFDGKQLIVQTGLIQRTWLWTGSGFLTQSITDQKANRVWHLQDQQQSQYLSDFQLPTVELENPQGNLLGVTVIQSDDEGFTSEHLLVEAIIEYPSENLQIAFKVRAYPDAPGLHVQLGVKATDGFQWDNTLHRTQTTAKSQSIHRVDRGCRRVDLLPCDDAKVIRRMFGYQSNLQFRNDTFTNMLKERVMDRPLKTLETSDWASAMCLESNGQGISLVKESHKCTNQPGVDGGLFVTLPKVGVENLGWGLTPSDIQQDQFTYGWATWCVVYADSTRDRQIAFKKFDRARFPLKPKHQMIQANTWGSSEGYLQHRVAAAEANVLKELESCSDLGIDLLQIDDGWQGDHYDVWKPCKQRYPEGWKNVVAKAKALGTKIGLWCAGQPVGLEDLKETFDHAKFEWYKLDFMKLHSRRMIDELVGKVREFELYTNHQAMINWDTTEVDARLGYFYGREYGGIYFANRKPVIPYNVTYRPHTVLRDLWELSAYVEVRQFLGVIQDPEATNPRMSNANQYSMGYCAAIGLVSLPTFFMETHLLSEESRTQLRPLIKAFKEHRPAMHQGMMHPVGQKPDGMQMTGFQCHDEKNSSGYLMLFRELECESAQGQFDLVNLPANAKLKLTNLLTGEDQIAVLEKGQLTINIENAADYRFMRYELA